MARGITEMDVLEAADALLVRGERPTIERVRQELGRGSPNTVNRHLDAWWRTLSARLQKDPANQPLSAALLDLCQRLLDGLRDEALRSAESLLEEARSRQQAEVAGVEAMRSAAEADRLAADAARTSLAEELTALRERNEDLAGEKAKLASDVARLTQDAFKASSVAHAASATVEELTKQHLSEVQRIRGQWEGNEKRWLDEILALREDAKRFRTERAGQIKTLEGRLKDATAAAAEAQKDRARLSTELSRAEANLAKEREARVGAEAALRATDAVVRTLKVRPTPAPRERRRTAKERSGIQ